MTVRVAPAAEPFLTLLDEGCPKLPLPTDVGRDEHGGAHLRLTFERRPHGAARHLLRLGANIEVLAPPELRLRMRTIATALTNLHDDHT